MSIIHECTIERLNQVLLLAGKINESFLTKEVYMTVEDRIKKQLQDNTVVLYMKGTPSFPQCGFSGRAVHMLKQCGADFMAVNVLEDPEIREGIKEYGNWPTIPQLYVNGELIGGSDIMTELFESGELQQILINDNN